MNPINYDYNKTESILNNVLTLVSKTRTNYKRTIRPLLGQLLQK